MKNYIQYIIYLSQKILYWNVIFMNNESTRLKIEQHIFQSRNNAILKATAMLGENANGFDTISCRPALRIEIKF